MLGNNYVGDVVMVTWCNISDQIIWIYAVKIERKLEKGFYQIIL